MNLQSSILRDGKKVYYLHIPYEEEVKSNWLSVLTEKISRKNLLSRVWKSNKSKQHGKPRKKTLIKWLGISI